MWLYLILVVIVLAPVGAIAALYVPRIRVSRGLVANSTPVQTSPEPCRRTIVIAGDSTAVGVGALPQESVAGRIAAAFPQARIINVSQSGARIGHVVGQLERLDIRSADLVLIDACANDVLEFRPLARIEADLRAAIGCARGLTRNVILMPGHNFSVAPFFLRPLAKIVTWHALRTHEMVVRVACELNLIFVDLFRDEKDDPFVQHPRRYYCPDGLHPSGEGYALWFDALLSKAGLARFLAPSGSD